MKRRFQKQQGLTIVEVLVVIAVLLFLVWMFLPIFARAHIHGGTNCVSNLKQVALSFQIWESDNNNKYPMEVSVTNGGAMELIVTGNVAGCLMVMTNELSTPKILVCPADRERTEATNFGDDFNATHISYFIGVDVTNDDPAQRILCGDDNFLVNGFFVKSGLLQYPTNIPIAWGAGRHKFVGNISYADGSVAELSSAQLQEAFLQAGLATNRIAIP